MDIKWKSISQSLGLRLTVTLLALSGVLIACSSLPYWPTLEYALEPAEYTNSHHKDWLLAKLEHSLYEVVNYYHDEAYIESGESTREEMESLSRQRRRHYNLQVAEINEQYATWISSAELAKDDVEVARLLAEKEVRLQEEADALENDIAQYQASLINTHLSNYREHMAALDASGVYFCYVDRSSGEAISNLPDTAEPESFFASLPAQRKNMGTEGTYYLGISTEKFQALEKEFTDRRSQGLAGIYRLAAGTLLFLTSFGLTLTTAGKRAGKNESNLTLLDKIYLDVGGFILVLILYFCGVGVLQFGALSLRQNNQLYAWLVTTPALFAALATLTYGSIVSKRAKRGGLIRHTLLYAVLAWAISLLRKWFRKLEELVPYIPLAWRKIGLLFAYAAAVSISLVILTAPASNSTETMFSVVLFFLSNVGAVSLLLRRTAALQNVISGAERIKNGTLSYRIEEKGSLEMVYLASLINNIATGLARAVENEVKSERMKAELITNVSHDLKTPLTSLITYIDLLKREGLGSDNAAKYLDVLDRKSRRLQALTDDLFEAAKAASGTIAMNKERIDIGSLLTQGLGELSEKLEASPLDWRVNIPEEKLYVEADGRLLWRVMENLISNILKYALAGSRVYVTAERRADTVCVTFKNISAAPLNIDPAELMERFTRGDASRQGDGNGLGLAIAKSLTELQGGTFTITIDGDLFKASVSLPYYA